MGSGVRDKYSVAINSKGFMLRGAPNNPAYRRDEQPTSISRLALSDLQYSDFSGSGTFFTAQTDWSAGVKHDKTWKDDAKYYYSTNIDAYSEPGAFKLEKQLESQNDFSENLACGTYTEVNNASHPYVGTYENDGSSRPIVYKFDGSSWGVVGATTSFSTSQNLISQLIGHKNKLYALTVGVGNTTVVMSWDGSNWTDKSSDIITPFTGSDMGAARCGCELAGTLYLGIDDSLNNHTSIMSTADGGTTWVEELYMNTDKLIIDMIGYNGMVYYLLYGSSTLELRVFDPATNADTQVAVFYGTSSSAFAMGGRLLFVLGGKLIVTVPSKEIYDYDGTTLRRIWQYDQAKNTIGVNADFRIVYGGIASNNKIYWGNLIYDGEVFYNWKKDSDDNNFYIPLYRNSSDTIFGYSLDDSSILLQDTANYKGTLAQNFLVFSEMSPVVSIDKLLYSITVVFDVLAANEQIAAEYSTNGGSTWTALTTMTSTTESTGTKREFIIPNSVIYNKIFVRVKLAGTTTTPTVRDMIVGYKPIPNYKNRWSLRLDMSDGVKLLNNQQDERKGIELYSELWNEKAAKQIVNFEDIDYVECSLVSGMAVGDTSALVNHTRNFPRRGRIRAVSGGVAEEMIYTSADSNKIRGISRAQRGTRARAYGAGQALNSAYSVYIERMQSEINWTDENKSEHIATVTLLEA